MSENLNQMVDILSKFSAIATSLVVILGLLSTVFKPIRNFIVWLFKKLWGSRDKTAELMQEIKNIESTLSKKIEDIKNDLSAKIDAVSNNADTYERKRLKDKIFEYGNRARHGDIISGEEFRNLQEIYADYSKLGGNSIAHDEMNYITYYYNNNGWQRNKEMLDKLSKEAS